jgi:hypothetical protein
LNRRERCWTVNVIGLLLVLLVACGTDRPLVERYERGAWKSEPYRIASMGGQRAGATVTFVLRLEESSGRRMVIEGTVEIDPQATLIGGSWAESGGPSALSGVLSSASIDFFGGQGDRPSLGGQLTLSAGESPVYRINLPTTRLSAER